MDVGCVYVVPGRAGVLPWEQLLEHFCEATAPSVARARELGVRLAFEPCAQIRTDISFVNTLSDALDVADLTGLDVVVDFAGFKSITNYDEWARIEDEYRRATRGRA
jgi:sugar phosphate isomerase/epimerase